LVLVRDRREREARTVRITTQSERSIWVQATTRSARAKSVALRLVESSNFII